MYESGITILDCIRLSEDIVNNEVIESGLRRAGELISEGQSVTAAFQGTGIFPPLIIRMLKIGEATGSLDTALRNVSYFYNREHQGNDRKGTGDDRTRDDGRARPVIGLDHDVGAGPDL